MNKAQLRARTRQLSGVELDGLRSDEEVDLLIEEAYRQIGQLTAWRWREALETFETEEDEAVYELPAGVDEIRGLAVLDASGHQTPVPLREHTLRDLLHRVRRDDGQLPRFYARSGSRDIRLAPTPDRVYTIEVYGLAPLQGLDNDLDEPEWDSRFHAAIAYLAAAVFLDEEGQDELALHRRGRAEELMTDMMEHYQTSRDTTPIQLGGGSLVRPVDPLGKVYPWRA